MDKEYVMRVAATIREQLVTMTTPSPLPCDSPHVVTVNNFPYIEPAMVI